KVTIFFSSRRRHTRFSRDWSSDVCSSDLRAWSSISPSGVSRQGVKKVSGKEPSLPSQFLPLAALRLGVRSFYLASIGNRHSLLRSEERRVGKEERFGE